MITYGKQPALDIKNYTANHILSKIGEVQLRLQEIFAQEAVLNELRIRERSTDERLIYTWRSVRAEGSKLMDELVDLSNSLRQGGVQTNKADVLKASTHNCFELHADFQKVNFLFLVYPEGVTETYDGKTLDYSNLVSFYDELIPLVPEEVKIIVFAKKASLISKVEALRRNVQCIVNSDINYIWLRDIAGFNMGNALVKPVFRPKKYLDVKTSERINQSIRSIHSFLGVDLIDLPIVWDGGNLVTNGEIGFITDRIYWDNKGDRNQTLNQIREVMGIEPVLVDELPKDETAHTDGYMAFLDKSTIAISQYPESWYKDNPKDKGYLDKLCEAAREKDLNVVRINEFPTKERPHDFGSAKGSYINFLRLNDLIIMPSYPGYVREEDETAVFETLSQYGRVVKIDCTAISEYGGVLHCISFTW